MSRNKQDAVGLQNIETRLIHGETAEGDASKALAPPIHMSSSFSFDTIGHAEDVMAFESSDYVYTRGNNPTLRLFENRMSSLEGGTAAVAFASGMAAISSVLLSLAGPGDTILTHKTVYGSTHTVTAKLLPRYGIHSASVDLTDPSRLEEVLAKDADGRIKVLFFESPANPTLAVIDIKAIAEIAHCRRVTVVVDNTFATPYLQNPLALGADVVVHSATKYICGHGDAMGGVAVTGNSEYGFSLKFDYMCELGGVMSPFNAWLMLRGLKTLAVRMDRHVQNAGRVADFLENHPRVRRVHYPGLASHAQFDIAARQMRGAGGIISFELEGNLADAKLFIDALKIIKTAVSLGDCETLVQLPAAMTHRGYDRERLADFGLTESMIRLSIGIEHGDNIVQDIAQALDV